jgi:ABC-2 type transport system ATP-binding protein
MIRANGVTVTFRRGLRRRRIHALQDFGLDIERGDIYALLGPNGAGKSTAMYCFLGLIRPEHGSVTVLGQAPTPGAEIFQRIAYLPEEPHYHDYLTVREAVAYYGALGLDRLPQRRVDEAIARVSLEDAADLRLSKCSKGMRQKAGIAACLLRDIDLLLMDEPTRGLDPMTVSALRSVLLELNTKGTTIVINSHMLSEVEAVCTRAAIVDAGRVVVEDRLDNIMEVDAARYSVDLVVEGDLPDFFTVARRDASSVHGEIAASDLERFLLFARSAGAVVRSCSHKRMSLEEAFMKVLGGRR